MGLTMEKIKQYLIESYDNAFARFGDDPRAVKWLSKASQEKRFRILTEIGNLSGTEILDVGCGKGDFYGYLKNHTIPVTYTGIDINKNFIQFAQKKYPDAYFSVLDIGKEILPKKFDYTFICGLFSELYPTTFVCKTLLKTFRITKKALGFNLISQYSKRREPGFRYESPEEIFQFCMKNLSELVSLRHDYMNENFTIFVYRHPSITTLDQHI